MAWSIKVNLCPRCDLHDLSVEQIPMIFYHDFVGFASSFPAPERLQLTRLKIQSYLDLLMVSLIRFKKIDVSQFSCSFSSFELLQTYWTKFLATDDQALRLLDFFLQVSDHK